METLAGRTAGLHRAFAMRSGDPAFEPEPLTRQEVQAWKERVKREAEQTLPHLEGFRKEVLFSKIEACDPPEGPALKTRHHGDYHLGQVLVSNNDFVIIDFEGEPSRPLEEGRAKRSPLRDVAGMLRSFDYAKWSAMKRVAPAESGVDVLAELEAWQRATREAFLRAYAAAMEDSRVFASFDDVLGLLELAEIEKLLYEVRYEAANRPDWLHIPLAGLKARLA
jgi:maltose alpha-D-glucosyltransferase/alpha-amylase